jgi:hypothetical protein
MILTEIIDDFSATFTDPSRDQSVPKLHDLRKTKLTLAQISRLRMMKDVRDVEKNIRLGKLKQQYGQNNSGGL